MGAKYQGKMLATQDMIVYTKQMEHKNGNFSHRIKDGWHLAEFWEREFVQVTFKIECLDNVDANESLFSLPSQCTMLTSLGG